MPLKTPQPALFIIADISGYTQFMLSNREALLHSQIIISELMRSILREVQIPLEIAKLEGDAVFMYALKQGDFLGKETDTPIHLKDFGPKLLRFMTAFMAKLKEIYRVTTCSCSACTNLEALRLKIVAHSGEALFYQLDRFEELSGPDVIIVHRLLKNSVQARQYILLTDTVAQELQFPERVRFQQGTETYEDFGTIATQFYTLPDLPLARWDASAFQRDRHFHPYDLSDRGLFDRNGDRQTQHRNDFPALLPEPEQLTNPATAVSQTVRQWQHHIWVMWRSILLSLGLQRFTPLSHLSLNQDWQQSQQSDWVIPLASLRWGISAAFFLGGIRLAFPEDPQALAQSYIDPQTGFISAFVADQIVNRLGLSMARFLQIQGLLEIAIAIPNLFWGAHTPMTGLMIGFMFWAFTIANPVVGAISLSQDIALAAFCLAIALTGPAAWDRQGHFRRQDWVLLLLRLGLSYTLLVSALFTQGVMGNPLNQTIPVGIVFVLGLCLGLGIATRVVAALVALWLAIVVGTSTLHWLMNDGVSLASLYWGLETVKREIPLAIGAGVLAWMGRDRWTWPKRKNT